MPDLLRLPLRVADLGTRPARFVIGKLLELRHSGDDEATATPAPTPAAQRATAPPPPIDEPARPKPKKRAPAAKGKPSVKEARRATRHEPTKGQAAAIREAERKEEWGEDNSVGANVVIDPEVLKLADQS